MVKKVKKEAKIDYRKKRKEIKERKKKRREKEKQKKLLEIYGDDDGYESYDDDYRFEELQHILDNSDYYLNLNRDNSNPPPSKKRKLKDKRDKRDKKDNKKNSKKDNEQGPVWAPYKRYSGTFEDRLHEEILDFVNYITPNKAEINTRLYTIDKLRKELHYRFPDSNIACFGSFSTGLFLPTSDLDVVVYRPGGDKNSASYSANPTQGNQSKNLNKIAKHIHSNGFYIHKVIRHSRIPIIKAEDDLTHYLIDISYNQQSGVPAINYIKQNIKKYPALKPLVYLLKHFLYINDMNEVFTGGLGSFSVVCLVLSYLKFYPKIFYETEGEECVIPDNLGTLFINFLYLFGGGFDYENIGISVDDGSFYRKMDKGFYNFKNRHLLSIEDPIMPGNDLTKGSHRISEIAQAWKQALDILRRGEEKDVGKVKKNQPSLLSKILYIDYEEIKRRKEIREYIYPQVIKKTGDVYTSISPFVSSDEEEDEEEASEKENIYVSESSSSTSSSLPSSSSSSTTYSSSSSSTVSSSSATTKIEIESKVNGQKINDPTTSLNKEKENNYNISTNNSSKSNYTIIRNDEPQPSNIIMKEGEREKKENEDEDDENDGNDGKVSYNEVINTMKNHRINTTATPTTNYNTIISSDEDLNEINNHSDDEFIAINTDEEEDDDENEIDNDTDDDDDDDDDYSPSSNQDDSDSTYVTSNANRKKTRKINYPKLKDNDEIYIYDEESDQSERRRRRRRSRRRKIEEVEEEEEEELENKNEDITMDEDGEENETEKENDTEYDDFIAKQEDDAMDEEEFDSDLYQKLGDNFLDEDTIDIDELLYK